MKNVVSLITSILIFILLISVRVHYSDIHGGNELKVTTWDAFGYYMYLPSVFIYRDLTKLAWLPEMDEKYNLTGGYLYQAHKQENGNYVFSYLGGVALLEIPFFFAGHLIAGISGYDTDGFSAPYQYALAFGILFYVMLAIFLLRHILLRYFSDLTTAITLLLLMLATNFIQYACVDNGMSHAYIFPLYVLLIYATLKWHRKPSVLWASLVGFTIGFAVMCRPTEAVMLFIPLFWDTHSKGSSKQKWARVRKYRSHLLAAFLFGFIGILPQLIYWKYSSGSFIHEVGSAWDFLTPHLRVLTGFEKGWFIYTPVTLFFIIGLFHVREYPFGKAVIYFCLINIYIIISWRDWRYGAGYSTRALVQSYPVFALALAAWVEYIRQYKWQYAFYVLGIYLIIVNLFQITQYNKTILHYDDMNRRYYGRIYLNRNPTPLDMSLLDTGEWLRNEKKYDKEIIYLQDSIMKVNTLSASSFQIAEQQLPAGVSHDTKEKNAWLRIDVDMNIRKGFYGCYLNSKLISDGLVKQSKIRLSNPISPPGTRNRYSFYMKVPSNLGQSRIMLYITSESSTKGEILYARITLYR